MNILLKYLIRFYQYRIFVIKVLLIIFEHLQNSNYNEKLLVSQIYYKLRLFGLLIDLFT